MTRSEKIMEWRRLRTSEIDHEVIWLAVSVAVAGLAAVWLKAMLPSPGCPLHAFTGLPCPACGGTRCLHALAHGNLGAAFVWNPLVFLALASVVLFDFYALAVLLFRLPRARVSRISPKVALMVRCAVVAMVAANWLYLIVAGR